MKTLTPADRHAATASITPDFGGSIIATKPTKEYPSYGKFIVLTEYSTFSFGIFKIPNPKT